MSNSSKNCSSIGFTKGEGDLCVHHVDATNKCFLGDPTPEYNTQGINACFDAKTNKANYARGRFIGGTTAPLVKKVQTMRELCSQRMPFGQDPAVNMTIIDDITHLQDRERTLMNNLRLSVTDDPNPKTMTETMYVEQLEQTRKARMILLSQLSNAYTAAQCSLSSNRRALADMMAMAELGETQLTALSGQQDALKDSRTNKHRMVQITNYENDRYASHTSIFRMMAFCSLFILGGISLNNMGWKTLGNIVIILALVVLVVNTISQIWTNWWRSPMNWNQFEWEKRERVPHYETVWEHDVNAFRRGYHQAKNEAEHLYDSGSTAAEKYWGQAKKAAREANKDVSKEIDGNTTHHRHRKKHHKEQFAPY